MPLAPLFLLAFFQPAPATTLPGQAPPVSLDAASALFRAIEGQWDCSGAFASGKPLAADLGFSATLDGNGVRFSHVDREPNTYRQVSHWGVDSQSGQLISLALTTSGAGKTNAALYVAEALTPTSVTFVHKRLLADPFAPNRFTYTLADPHTLKKLWEVNRNGGWRMGDYLDCTRKTAAT